MDTIIVVDGVDVRFDCEFAASYRDKDGAMTARGLRELAIDACESGALENEEKPDTTDFNTGEELGGDR
jgi:hypothetical protein